MDNNILEKANLIANKIKEFPLNVETTIAELINYNPETNMVEPLTQGKIYKELYRVCYQMGMDLEQTYDGFGGLAYFYTFKRIK